MTKERISYKTELTDSAVFFKVLIRLPVFVNFGIHYSVVNDPKLGGLLHTIVSAVVIFFSISFIMNNKLPGGYYASVFVVAANTCVIYKSSHS